MLITDQILYVDHKSISINLSQKRKKCLNRKLTGGTNRYEFTKETLKCSKQRNWCWLIDILVYVLPNRALGSLILIVSLSNEKT